MDNPRSTALAMVLAILLLELILSKTSTALWKAIWSTDTLGGPWSTAYSSAGSTNTNNSPGGVANGGITRAINNSR
jgi:hypothetical protein